MKGKVELSLEWRELILWLIIFSLIIFNILRAIHVQSQIETLRLTNQVKANTQSINNIATWIDQQIKNQAPTLKLEQKNQED